MNELQQQIMQFVIAWIKINNLPVPRQMIIIELSNGSIKEFTIVNAIDSLVKKGYIARSRISSRTTSYRQLRGL